MAAAAASVIIQTLSRGEILKAVAQYGPETVLVLWQMLNRQKEGAAWNEQQKTYQEMREAIPGMIRDIREREIRVVPQAFNSAPTFLDYFQAAALGGIPLVLLDLTSAIKRVGASLDAIRSELAIANVATIQGWGDGGFGAYVHRFVQNEMATVNRQGEGGAGNERHFFYVWHPDSDWYPVFEQKQIEDSLGPAFGGYHHELETICLRMRSDRRALIATTDYGRTAIFHLIIPAYQPLVIDHPIAFADELLPLVVTGSRHRGTDLVWFELWQKSQGLQLNYISILPDRNNPAVIGGAVGFVGCWLGVAGCAVASAAFPPCAPVAAIVADGFGTAAVGSWTVCAAGGIYGGLTQKETLRLGDPVFLE